MSNNKALKGLKVPGLDDIYYVPDINQVVYMDVEDNENVEDVAGLEAQIAQIKTQLADKVSNSQLQSSLADKVNSAQLENSLANKVSVVEQNLTAEQQATVRENIGAASSEDVSAAIANTAAKVGDTLTTIRTDLDDTWLLCNGDVIECREHTEFNKLIDLSNTIKHPEVLDLWEGTGNYNRILCATYSNGYWVVGGSYYDGSKYYARIAYTQSLTGTWTTKDLWDSAGPYDCISCITYANGYWVVGGVHYDSASSDSNKICARIAYTQSLTGTWTTKDLWRCTNPAEYSHNLISCITYADGYWVVGGVTRSAGQLPYIIYARIAYTQSLTGTWTMKDLWTEYTNNEECISSIAYANGYWVVAGYHKNSSTTSVRISYTQSLTGTWTTKDLWDSAGSGAPCITYADGYWVVGGFYYDSESSNYFIKIAYTKSLANDWTIKGTSNTVKNSDHNKISIFHDGRYWLICTCSSALIKDPATSQSRYATSAIVLYGRSLSGTMTNQWIWHGDIAANYTVDYRNEITCIASDGSNLLVCGSFYTTSINKARIAGLKSNFSIPSISTSGVYTYIKVK